MAISATYTHKIQSLFDIGSPFEDSIHLACSCNVSNVVLMVGRRDRLRAAAALPKPEATHDWSVESFLLETERNKMND